MSKYVDFLKETDLFYNLTPAQLEMIDSICVEQICKNGDLIISENSKNSELYLILHGAVEVSLNPGMVASIPGSVTRPHSIAVFERGQSFGEIALVDEGIRSASVHAKENETRLLKISRDRLLLLCRSYPELGFKVMSNLAADLAGKIRNSDLKIREIVLYQKKA